MADDRNDHPSSAQTHSFGAAKDDLFGWLVDRAAADLGLAQAIAASEAQRNEQLKRLEESLLARVQELNKQPGTVGDSAVTLAGIDDLKAEIQTFTERMGRLESATQQTHHQSGALKAEIAAVENQIADQQGRIESGNANFTQLEHSISAKVRELEQQLGAAPHAPDNLIGAIAEVSSQLQAVVERVTGCELFTGAALTRAELETERWRWTAEVDERVMTQIREFGDEIREKLKAIGAVKLDQEAGAAELAELVERLAHCEAAAHQAGGELKAELWAHREASRNHEDERKAGAKLLQEQLDGFEQKLAAVASGVRAQGETAVASHRQEVDSLTARMEALAKSVNDNDATRGAEQMRWKNDIEESLAARLAGVDDSLVNRLEQKLAAAESGVRAQWETAVASHRQEVDSLTARMEALAKSVNDIDATRGTEQMRWKNDIEESLAARLAGVGDSLNELRRLDERQIAKGSDLKLEMHALAERMAKVEFAAQQTQALSAVDSQRAEQIAAALKTEITSFTTDVTEQFQRLQAPEASLMALDEKFAHEFDAMHGQIAQTRQQSDSHDQRFQQFNSELQTLLRRVSEAEGDAHQTRALIVNESEQNAQQRDGLRSEHEALRAQLSASRAHDTAIQDLEEKLRRQMSELERQLAQRLRLLEQRDADFRELTTPPQTLRQQSLRAEIPPPVFSAAALAPLVATPVDIHALRTQREGSICSNAPSDKPPQAILANVLESPLSNDILSSGNRDQLKLLQERISADIERARNELREKSGRWKVRR